ncbi:hypothetical protein BDR06DRAFT_967098 [Suillus hirtellus]|nr:hypothetical protein BDR06DRAFT_967098 [Suillus hirtellus]
MFCKCITKLTEKATQAIVEGSCKLKRKSTPSIEYNDRRHLHIFKCLAKSCKQNEGQDYAWTAPNHKAFVVISVHLKHEGEPLVMLLNIIEVPKSHTSLNLAEAFTKVLLEFGVSNKILSITANNAENNDMMMAELADKVVHFRGEIARTQCFLHIVNLVAKSILKQFDIPKKQVDNLLGRDEELHKLGRDIDLEDENSTFNMLDFAL